MTTYNEVNAAWPVPMPVPTPREAIHGTKSLIRKAFALAKEDGAPRAASGYGHYVKGRKFKLTSGRRITWPRHGVWSINPDERRRSAGLGGWSEIVHSVSHWAQRQFWPTENPHGPRHVWLERELAAHAIECMPRWVVATAGEKIKTKPDVRAVRAARVAARIKRWTTIERRATKALKKLHRQARYYGLNVS